ncbi:MAG: carbonic anhydrase [Bacillota bacterium]|nr:carbonic anhydrase [Bacillota bacterium]MDW7683117.1 carbonic anhydrase [Bacillota bacterium]
MKIISLENVSDLPVEFVDTPIEQVVRYHNFNEPFSEHIQPEILIGKCMDYRVVLRLPPRFAYKLRTGGCNLGHHDFHVAYAVAVGGVKAVALIGHTDCGMVSLEEKREKFVRGFMAQSGWPYADAELFFDRYAKENSLCRESDILFEEAARYRRWFPKLPIATFLYRLDDQRLHLLQESSRDL